MFRCGEVARESNAAANLRRIGTVVVCSSSCWLLIRSSLGDQSPSARVHPLGDTVASLGLQGTDQRLVRVGRACIAGQAALHHAVGRSSYRQASVGLAACAVPRGEEVFTCCNWVRKAADAGNWDPGD